MTSQLSKVEQEPEDEPAREPGAGAGPAEPQPSTEPRWPDGDLPARIDKLQEAANAASAHARNVYVTFLLFGLYLAIIFGSTTHEQLLRESEVTLPLLNVGLPLVGFYWVAPALFVLLHLNLLIQLYLLSQKLHRLDRTLRLVRADDRVEEQRAQLYPFTFSQMLIGWQHDSLMRSLIWLMVWLTVFVLPVVLLLAAQVRFLPYHDAWTTMWHRVLVAADVLLILNFWRPIRYPTDRLVTNPFRWLWHQMKALPLALAALGLSLLIFTFPGDAEAPDSASTPMPGEVERIDFGDPAEEWLLRVLQLSNRFSELYLREGWRHYLRASLVNRNGAHPTFAPTSYLFERLPFLSRNLVVEEINLVSSWPTQAQIDQFGEELAWQNFGRPPNFRGRDLRYASLSSSILARADLRNADLEGSDLAGANLRNASLAQAELSRANLTGADLEGSDLTGAKLSGSSAALTNLRGTQLNLAELQNVNLLKASLEGATLDGANLQGAKFETSNLSGANLSGADLRGASFDGALLDGANLAQARLQAVTFQEASLRGADLTGANLQAADLRLADLQGAKLGAVAVQGGPQGCRGPGCPYLEEFLQEFLRQKSEPAKLEGADLRDANTAGADLRGTNFWRALLDNEDGPTQRWLLTDLREAGVEPIENVDLLIEQSVEDIADLETRDRVAERLRLALHGADRREVPLFPKVWDSDAMVMFDPGGRLSRTLGWGTPVWETVEAYDENLARFLGELACGEDATAYVAQGLARRAVNDRGRVYVRRFSEHLIVADCPALPEEMRKQLMELAGLS